MVDVWALCKEQATCVEKLWRERSSQAQPADPLPAEGGAGAEGLPAAAGAAQAQAQSGVAAEGVGAKLAGAEAASAQVGEHFAGAPCSTAEHPPHADRLSTSLASRSLHIHVRAAQAVRRGRCVIFLQEGFVIACHCNRIFLCSTAASIVQHGSTAGWPHTLKGLTGRVICTKARASA